MKGRNSKLKGGKGLTAEDKLLKDRLANMDRMELERKMVLHRRKQLKEEMEAEAANTKVNRFNIQNQWRKYMRMAKVESLRKDLEILSQNHERDVDRKDVRMAREFPRPTPRPAPRSAPRARVLRPAAPRASVGRGALSYGGQFSRRHRARWAGVRASSGCAGGVCGVSGDSLHTGARYSLYRRHALALAHSALCTHSPPIHGRPSPSPTCFAYP